MAKDQQAKDDFLALMRRHGYLAETGARHQILTLLSYHHWEARNEQHLTRRLATL